MRGTFEKVPRAPKNFQKGIKDRRNVSINLKTMAEHNRFLFERHFGGIKYFLT